jgi:hypothetical protein
MSTRRLAALTMVALLGAGCGSTAASQTGATSTAKPTARAQLVKFAECMRTHGVGDFPDPDSKGDFKYGISVSETVWQDATRACKDLEPRGIFSAKRTPKQQSGSLKFADCIRANGVKDFPDPVNGQPLVDTNRIPSANKPGGMTILNAAMAKCRGVMAKVLGGQ